MISLLHKPPEGDMGDVVLFSKIGIRWAFPGSTPLAENHNLLKTRERLDARQLRRPRWFRQSQCSLFQMIGKRNGSPEKGNSEKI